MDKKEIISRVEKLLKERKGIVMVLTVDKFSMPHGRYMDCTRGDDNLSLYFATFVNTEKVEQLKNNPNAEVVVTGKNFVETANLSGVMNFYDADFRDRLLTMNRHQPTIIYCRSGNRSGQALEIMRELGFRNVYDMRGGIAAWQSAGYPVQR